MAKQKGKKKGSRRVMESSYRYIEQLQVPGTIEFGLGVVIGSAGIAGNGCFAKRNILHD